MLSIRRVLFPTDFSTSATHAFPRAASFASRHDAELHIVRVPETDQETVASLPVAANVLKEWLGPDPNTKDADLEALTVVQRQMEPGNPSEQLLKYVEGHDIDLVVMGTHGRRGIRRMMLGSVTEEVLRTAPCPVLTVRTEEETETRPGGQRILAPVDFSDAAETAVRHAIEIAGTDDAELHLLHVVEEVAYTSAYGVEPPLIPHNEVVARVEKRLGQMAREKIGREDVRVSAKVGQAPWTILDYADANNVGLIVIATHGRSGLDRVLFGSVAERVLRHSPVPVFVVKPDQMSLLPSAPAEGSTGDG